MICVQMNSYGKGGDKGVGVNIMCNLDVAVCVWGGGCSQSPT